MIIPQELQNEAIALINQSKKILVIPSSPLDGDSLGSAISLYLALKKINKDVTAVCADDVPTVYNFLPGMNKFERDLEFVRDFIVTIDTRNIAVENIVRDIQPDKVNIIITPKSGSISEDLVSFDTGKPNFDLIITVDAAEPAQFKHLYTANAELFKTVPVINIDHHISNTQYGKVNIVDNMAPSATTLVMKLLEALGSDLIDADVATLLLAGLITDTGSFQNPNTTPDAFSVAAHLIELGARQQEIIQHIYKTKQLSTLKLWGRILSKLEYDEAHKFVWSSISKQDLADTESKIEEADGVIDELMSNAPGAEIVLLLKDKGEGVIGGSLRTTTSQVDANAIAEHFGGGGHVQAAGFKIEGKNLNEVKEEVAAYINKKQGERHGSDRTPPSPQPSPDSESETNQPESAPLEMETPLQSIPQEPPAPFPAPVEMEHSAVAPEPQTTAQPSQIPPAPPPPII